MRFGAAPDGVDASRETSRKPLVFMQNIATT